MKKINKVLYKVEAILAALVLSVGAAPAAKAVAFTYEDTISGHTIGETFTGGGFRINLQDFDMGTLYPSLGAPGSAVGYGAGGASGSVAAGYTALDGIQTAGATGSRNGEDSWGIARIVTITDLAGSIIWSEAGKNAQMTVFFYGEKDFYINQLANGFQEIDGTGLHADLYLQDKTDPSYTQYNPSLGSGGRVGLSDDKYLTVTDSNGTTSNFGNPFLTTESTGGFIHGDGTLGGLATEFASVFNATSGGTGQAYLSVTGGTDADQFNTNGFTSPFGTGGTADLFASFTTFVPSGVGDWLVSSNDPVRGATTTPSVPDTGMTLALLGGVLPVLAVLRRKYVARRN